MGNQSSSDVLGKKSSAKQVVDKFGSGKYLLGKTAIVTGGNSGIGLETCKVLAYAGCRVILCSRSVDNALKEIKREIQAPGEGNYVVDDVSNIIVKPLDLNDLRSVKSFAEDILKTETRIDYLILNAGVMAIKNREETNSGFERQIGVNHFGHAYLTQLLLPKLKAQTFPSRIVVLASVAHKFGVIDVNDLHFNKGRKYSPWDAYGQSKLANVMFAKILADQLKDTQITAVSVHPGLIGTGLWKHSPVLNFFMNFFNDKDIPQGASTTVWGCLAPAVPAGAYLNDCGPFPPEPRADDKAVRDALWKVTVEQLAEATKGF